MSRLLITGGSSYLGQHLVPLAAPDFKLLYSYFLSAPISPSPSVRLDIRDGNAVRKLVDEWRPDTIIHLAGSNRNPDMERVIRQGAENIAAACEEHDCRLIHLSTDVVFDGQSGPYKENDKPSPIHAYGRAKSDAEIAVSRYQNHVIIRTSLIYSLEKMDHSTEWTTTSLEKGEPVTLFTDQVRNPVWIETLCFSCLELATSDFTGVIHIAGAQAMSRAEFGMKLLRWWGYEQQDGLNFDLSSGQWPKDCRLDIDLASQILETPLPGVDQVLGSKPVPN